jgi:predicted DNA-binding transcriptional regulator AlpA
VTSASVNMTVERAQTLPPVVDVPTAAAILGIGRTAAYELIRTGAWPTPILRLADSSAFPVGPYSIWSKYADDSDRARPTAQMDASLGDTTCSSERPTRRRDSFWVVRSTRTSKRMRRRCGTVAPRLCR